MTEIDFREVPAGSMLDEFHFEMWAGCMEMLLGRVECRKQFEEETGTPPIRAPRSGLEALIDKACGVDGVRYAAAFCRWATPIYWGDQTFLCPAIEAKLAT